MSKLFYYLCILISFVFLVSNSNGNDNDDDNDDNNKNNDEVLTDLGRILSEIIAADNNDNNNNNDNDNDNNNNNNIEKYPLVKCAIQDEPFYIQVRPDWSPLGAKRFLDLIEDHYFDNCALFRALENFIIQFGIAEDREKAERWAGSDTLKDEIPTHGKKKKKNLKKNQNEGQEDQDQDQDQENQEDQGEQDQEDESEDEDEEENQEEHGDNDVIIPKIPFTRGIMSYAGSGPNSRQTQMFFTLVNTDWLGRSPWEQPFAKIIYNDEILDKVFYGYGEQPDQGLIWNEGYEYLRREFPELSYLDYCRDVTREELFRKKNKTIKKEKEKVFDEIRDKDDEMKDNPNKTIEQFGYRVYLIEIVLVSIVLIILYFIVYRLARIRGTDKAE